ncbi:MULTISPECIES: TolC family protein [Brucella/Ochrobactrum group]|jgi:outer membrane protein TolC|uniref:TolC family protein n=1 Tax=Brucella/Ochrobactrum group TaxID=2826938 RepID=UPI001C03BD4C|nr:TolC family protein [Brucella sp. NBRC 12950]QWK81059.1 TolC family protein [Ochrobactrum sp. BTU1]GLU27499.1 protein CyaE [Brucella sp. NBRC 12950]
MIKPAQPFAVILTVILTLVLNGCATDALKLAPEAPDKPWTDGKKLSSPKSASPDSKDFSVPANPELALISSPVSADTHSEYDLAHLIDLAQRSNPATRNAWEKARQAALSVGMVEATMLPIITANVIGGAQKTTTPVDVPLIGERDIDTTLKGVTPSVALQWLVFDFGQRSALADAAKQVSFAANVTFNAMHQKVIFDVTRTYYEYCASVAGYRISEQTLRNSKAVLAAVQARLNEGRATTVELALARQQVAQSELRIVRAQGQKDNTYQGLLAAMGVNAMLKIKVDGSMKQKLPASFDGVTQSVLESALSQRPDVIASYAALQATKSGVKVAQAEFMPKVFVAATLASSSNSFNAGSLPTIGNQSSGAGILIGATVPLFDGGLRAAQLKNAQSVQNAATETFRRVQLDAVAEIVVASNALRTALAANKAAGVLVQTSATAFDAALDSYKNGLGTITVVNETNNALLDAKLAQTDAQAGARIAAANLAFFTGALTSSKSLAGVRNDF